MNRLIEIAIQCLFEGTTSKETIEIDCWSICLIIFPSLVFYKTLVVDSLI